MTRPLPAHGTRSCYLRGCRQPECTAANKRYCKQYRVTAYTTGPRRTDVDPSIIELLHQYVDAGWTRQQIANLTDVDATTIKNLLNDKITRLHKETVARIAALPPQPPAATARTVIDATGTRRRGQALVAFGHTVEACAHEIGITPTSLSRILTGSRSTVTSETAKAMAALYRRWQGKPGPSVRSRLRAQRNGWHGPAAWDDIDDPNAQPDTGDTPDPVLLRIEQIAEDAEWLLHAGEDIEQIAARLGIRRNYVNKALAHARKDTAAAA